MLLSCQFYEMHLVEVGTGGFLGLTNFPLSLLQSFLHFICRDCVVDLSCGAGQHMTNCSLHFDQW